MKYITRELYRSIQDPFSATAEESQRQWKQACDAYQAELIAIKPCLPPSMRSFAEVTLHDGVVKSAVRPRPEYIELRIDASNNPWGPKGQFCVAFSGVQDADGLAEMVGDEWLYEEVHLNLKRGFEYCVLLLRTEFRVVADDVVFQPLAYA